MHNMSYAYELQKRSILYIETQVCIRAILLFYLLNSVDYGDTTNIIEPLNRGQISDALRLIFVALLHLSSRNEILVIHTLSPLSWVREIHIVILCHTRTMDLFSPTPILPLQTESQKLKNASFRIPIKTIAWPGCCWPWADLPGSLPESRPPELECLLPYSRGGSCDGAEK
jgi:hypothetical protein